MRWVDDDGLIPIGFEAIAIFGLDGNGSKHLYLKGWELISEVCFTSHHDPDPAMASRKQDEKRRYRLEFQIQTFVYATE